MKHKLRFPLLLLAALALSAAGVAACKQAEGARCQSDDDCEDGLRCNLAEKVCSPVGTTGGLDADPPPDAPADAPGPDAPPDAPPDAL
jgi:hypothetical protein